MPRSSRTDTLACIGCGTAGSTTRRCLLQREEWAVDWYVAVIGLWAAASVFVVWWALATKVRDSLSPEVPEPESAAAGEESGPTPEQVAAIDHELAMLASVRGMIQQVEETP